MQWKDVTGYSQGDKDRAPTSWSAYAGHFKISVTCSHVYYPGTWVAHAEPFFREFKLGVDSADAAKAKAVALVKEQLEAALLALSSHQDK